MDSFELRLECLKLARDMGASDKEVIETARKLYAFISTETLSGPNKPDMTAWPLKAV